MKIFEHLTSYGIVNFVEVAGIDLTKDSTHSIITKPQGSYISFAGKDDRFDKLDKTKISKKDLDEIALVYNHVYCLPLEEVNRDWHIKNKDFKKDDEFLTKMKKAKTLPIAHHNEHFMEWFIRVQPLLNEQWKSENKDYIQLMEQRILKNNQEMLMAFKNQDLKTIKKTIKLSADINFEENNKSALIYTIENQNLQLMKYLINKKVKISSNVQIDEGNKLYETFANYQKTFSKKFKM